MANMTMKGRRLPQDRLHRSLREPRIGVTKKPMSGGSAHTRVICSCCTPIFSRIGDTKAVSAAYENSMPITAAEMRTSSERVFLLQQHWLSEPFVLQNTQLWKEDWEVLNLHHVSWAEMKRKQSYRRQGYKKRCRPRNNLYAVDRLSTVNYLIFYTMCFGLLGHRQVFTVIILKTGVII